MYKIMSSTWRLTRVGGMGKKIINFQNWLVLVSALIWRCYLRSNGLTGVGARDARGAFKKIQTSAKSSRSRSRCDLLCLLIEKCSLLSACPLAHLASLWGEGSSQITLPTWRAKPRQKCSNPFISLEILGSSGTFLMLFWLNHSCVLRQFFGQISHC